jgi:hypothetical protein
LKIDFEVDGSQIAFVDKPGRIYKCPNNHCYKAYKNRTGLKYHLLKGQCKAMGGTPMRSEDREGNEVVYFCFDIRMH